MSQEDYHDVEDYWQIFKVFLWIKKNKSIDQILT